MVSLKSDDWKRIDRILGGIATVLCIVAVSLDIFTLIGIQVAPAATGRVICLLHSLGAIAEPMFPQAWLDYVHQACRLDPVEPAISMLNFMIKTALVIIASLIVFVPLLHRYFKPNSELPPEYWHLTRKQTYLKKLKGFLVAGLIFSVVGALNWHYHISYSPGHFPISFISKGLEDAAILGVFVGAYVALFVGIALVQLFGCYLIEKR